MKKFVFAVHIKSLFVVLIACQSFFIFSNPMTANEIVPINDPFEKYNRKIHKFNKAADKVVLRPISDLYGNSIPQSLRLSANNFYGNLQEPKRMANHLIQGEYTKASIDLSRFFINSTVGLLGLFDLASWIRFFPEETNFDATFSYFSVPSGPYIELPLLGPSSLRGSLGLLADYTVNPLIILPGAVPSVSFVTFEIVSIINDRFEYSKIIDTLLYDSSDSYSSSRLTYLQQSVRNNSDNDSIGIDLFNPLEDF